METLDTLCTRPWRTRVLLEIRSFEAEAIWLHSTLKQWSLPLSTKTQEMDLQTLRSDLYNLLLALSAMELHFLGMANTENSQEKYFGGRIQNAATTLGSLTKRYYELRGFVTETIWKSGE